MAETGETSKNDRNQKAQKTKDNEGTEEVSLERESETNDQDVTDAVVATARTRAKNLHFPKGFVNTALDISLMSANANQLRLLQSYNEKSSTYYTCWVLVIVSLTFQVLQGVVKVVLKYYPKSDRFSEMIGSLLALIITIVNVLLASLLQI